MKKRGLWFVLWVLMWSVGSAGTAHAQMVPDMAESKGEAAVLVRSEPVTWQEKYFGTDSPYRGLGVAGVTLVALLVLRRVLTLRMREYLKSHAYKPENTQKFMRTWKSVWAFGIVVFVLISLSGSLQLLGLSAGFLGMMLGWSLQAPVTGLAAWLMIVSKRPFRIGDRIIIAGVIGDVTDITLTHVVLNQVGGTVSGEEASGRGILIPNAILFSQTITNYTLDQKHMLDEVPVRVPFDADIDTAKAILLDAARAITGEIIAATGQEPFLRCEFFDAGVIFRLRYQTIPAERQRISSEIVDIILHKFQENYPKVRFGYAHSVVRFRRDDGVLTHPIQDIPE
jgi:small-conductance mechanosensitive channel